MSPLRFALAAVASLMTQAAVAAIYTYEFSGTVVYVHSSGNLVTPPLETETNVTGSFTIFTESAAELSMGTGSSSTLQTFWNARNTLFEQKLFSVSMEIPGGFEFELTDMPADLVEKSESVHITNVNQPDPDSGGDSLTLDFRGVFEREYFYPTLVSTRMSFGHGLLAAMLPHTFLSSSIPGSAIDLTGTEGTEWGFLEYDRRFESGQAASAVFGFGVNINSVALVPEPQPTLLLTVGTLLTMGFVWGLRRRSCETLSKKSCVP